MRKENYFDFWKGTAIIFVIAIHTFNIYQIKSHENSIDFNLIISNIIQVAVPLFLAISGYFMAQKDIGTLSKYIAFEKKQITRVYLPCLIWSLPYFVLSLYNRNSIIPSVITLIGCRYSVYYFIALIIQFYLLLPLLQKCLKNKILLFITFFVITCGTTLIHYVFEFRYHIALEPSIYLIPFIGSTVYFYLGIIYGKKQDLKIPVKVLCFCLLLLIGIRYVESIFLWNTSGLRSAFGFRCISTPFYNTVFILIVFSLNKEYKWNAASRAVSKLGTISFGVYLTHMYVLTLINQFTPGMNWLLKVPFVLTGSCLIIYVGRRYFPEFAGKYLGF